MSGDLSFIQLFLQASFIVQLVIISLVASSFFSWVFIITKKFNLSRVESSINKFERKFWSGGDLNALYNNLRAENKTQHATARLFCAGFREFLQLQNQKVNDLKTLQEGVWRAMQIALCRELTHLEKNLSFLATVQSISPYVGIFGTVWGIMHSFRALGTVQQATLSMVAPGMSEALIATAIGLMAAIPAGIFYNRYNQKVLDITNRCEIFMQEFINLLNRQAYATVR